MTELAPVIGERSLAMMCSIIHCKCCRCYVAVEMNNSDLLNQESVWPGRLSKVFRVRVVESLHGELVLLFHVHIPWLIDYGDNLSQYVLSLLNMGKPVRHSEA